MATLNICGFETGDTSELQSVSGHSIQTTTKRSGEYALRLNIGTGAAGFATIRGHATTGLHASLGRTAETFYTCYFRFAALPSGTVFFASVINAAAAIVVRVQCSSTGEIALVGTTTSSAIAAISAGTWYRLDMRVTSNSTSAASIDGGAEQTATAANVTQDLFVCGRAATVGEAAYDCCYDDILISSTGFPGEGKVIRLGPDGVGSYTGWTTGTGTSEAEVDEVPHDSNTTYIAVPNTGDNTARTFTMEDTTSAGVAGSVTAVKACAVVRTESLFDPSTIGVRLRSGSTDSNTSGAQPTTGFVLWAKLLDADPNGGGAWTTSGVDGIEVGVFAGTLDTPSGNRCTAVCAQVWCSGEEPPAGGNRRRRTIICGAAA